MDNTFFLLSPASLDPEWSCFTLKLLSWSLFSLCQREACKCVTTGNWWATAVWDHRAIPVDTPKNGQLCFHLGCVCGASGSSAFHQMGSYPLSKNNFGFFQDNCSVRPLLASGCDWRTGIHLLCANKMLKWTTDIWGAWEHLGYLACKSSLFCRPK